MPALPISARAAHRLTKRENGSTTALIAAAVVSCVCVALLTVCGLWIYQRWLRRNRERMARFEKETSSTPSSSSSSDSAPPSPALYPTRPQPRRKRRPRGLVTKPSVPDLPRISEEPRMSLEPSSVSPSVRSRPGTVVGGVGVQGVGGETRQQQSEKDRETEKEEVMDT